MNFSKNSQYQKHAPKDSRDNEQQFRAALTPLLQAYCEATMTACYLSTGDVEDAKKLAMQEFPSWYDNLANHLSGSQDNRRFWAMETFERLCDEYPVRWHQIAAQLSGEEALTAEGIRSIIDALPDWHQAITWLYIFAAVNAETIAETYQTTDTFSQKLLADVKHFLRDFFSRVVEVTDPAEQAETIRLLLREELIKALKSDRRFKAEMDKMLTEIFTWVAADLRPECEIDEEFDAMSDDIIAWQKNMGVDGHWR